MQDRVDFIVVDQRECVFPVAPSPEWRDRRFSSRLRCQRISAARQDHGRGPRLRDRERARAPEAVQPVFSPAPSHRHHKQSLAGIPLRARQSRYARRRRKSGSEKKGASVFEPAARIAFALVITTASNSLSTDSNNTGSMTSTGAIIASCPSALRRSAVRRASGKGRVTRMRISRIQHAGGRAGAQFASGIGAERLGVLDISFARGFGRACSVRRDHQPGKIQPVSADPRVTANRRAARAVEHCEKRPFGGNRDRGETATEVGASSMAAARRAVSKSPARIAIAIAPCPTDGGNVAGSSGVCARASSPSRRNPASASTAASNSPRATFSSRVPTLPRSSLIEMSGRARNTSACRRTEDVPTIAPGGNAASEVSLKATKTSRASSRAG